jgi:hypothetical protein
MTELPAQEKDLPETAPKRVWGGAQPGAGRPPMQFTQEERELVEKLSGYGLPQADIAALVTPDGISTDTLRAHFRKELDQGRAKANSGVGQRLWQKAMDGDTASLIWWSKAQMRWREEVNTQVAAPVTINLAWLPGRGVDAGYSTSGAQIIEGEAQPIGMIEESGQDLRVTDTTGAAGEPVAVDFDPHPPVDPGAGGGKG